MSNPDPSGRNPGPLHVWMMAFALAAAAAAGAGIGFLIDLFGEDAGETSSGPAAES